MIHVRWVPCQRGMARPQVEDVRWVPCHQGMARPQVADGGDALQVSRETANILNMKSRTADKCGPPAWWSSGGLTTPCLKKLPCYESSQEASDLTDHLDKRPKRKKNGHEVWYMECPKFV
jgi:hypothetical protein